MTWRPGGAAERSYTGCATNEIATSSVADDASTRSASRAKATSATSTRPAPCAAPAHRARRSACERGSRALERLPVRRVDDQRPLLSGVALLDALDPALEQPAAHGVGQERFEREHELVQRVTHAVSRGIPYRP